MIVGTGIDIVEIDRIRKAIARHPDTFIQRLFTPVEQALAARLRDPAPFYAGRWAAKEALVKALGTGIGPDCVWLEIEVNRDDRGKPVLGLSGKGERTALELGVNAMHLSISHEQSYACAMVVLERG